MTQKTLAQWLLPFVIALTFMTRLPVYSLLPKTWQDISWTKQHYGSSVLWYPIVGIILAVAIALILSFFPELPSLVEAAIAVTLLVLLTGGLHLDGLADSIDAACAAHGESSESHKEKVLKVFKDPTAGPMAVIALVLVLLLKVILLSYITMDLLWTLVLVLSVSRAMALLLLTTTPYVRSHGLGSALSAYSDQNHIYGLLALLLLLLFICFPIAMVFWLVASCLACVFLWRRFWVKAIGGVVGDCIGAAIELCEVIGLLVLCLVTL